MWLANQTRPDIANAVRAVARYANKRREVHWKTAIGILEYVFSTSDFGITFQRGSGLELIAFMLTMLVKLLTGGLCLVGLLCVRGLVCAGFPELKNA